MATCAASGREDGNGGHGKGPCHTYLHLLTPDCASAVTGDSAFIPMPSPPLNGCNGGVRERTPSWSDLVPEAAMQSSGWMRASACCRALRLGSISAL